MATNVTNRIRERKYLSVSVWGGTSEDFVSLDSTATAPVIGQIDGLKTVGAYYASVGGLLHGYWRFPFFVDPTQVLGFRINWTTGASVSDDFTLFNLLLQITTPDGVLGGPSVLPSTATANLIGANTAFLNKWTQRQTYPKDFLTRAQIEDGALLGWSVELDSVSGIDLSTEKVWVLGLEIDYVRHDYLGTPAKIDEPLSGILV